MDRQVERADGGVSSIPVIYGATKLRRPFNMTWSNVAALAIFVIGACVASITKNPTLAATLAGAGAGFAMKEARRQPKPNGKGELTSNGAGSSSKPV